MYGYITMFFTPGSSGGSLLAGFNLVIMALGSIPVGG